jgi:Cys-rich four helix bundle protein (predicted Tat secretion target)
MTTPRTAAARTPPWRWPSPTARSPATPCLAHCLVLLGDGDTSMGGCARAVRDMLAVCEMMSTLVSSGSAFFKDAAALCAKACGACKRECEKHIADHPECKACFDGCDAVLAELAKV